MLANGSKSKQTIANANKCNLSTDANKFNISTDANANTQKKCPILNEI